MTASHAVRPAPDPHRIRQAIGRLQALPAFYPTVQKALHLIHDPLSTNGLIEQVVSSDQAVAAKILQFANSAYFGFYSRVRTVSLAIALIGRDRIGTLLRRFLTEELIQMLSGRKPAASDIRDLSLATATAAHSMAERLLREDKEELLVAGLLHNVGELVLLSQFRESYEEMVRLAERMPRAEVETAVFGVESRLVGKWLLEAWNFPRYFTAILEHYPDPWSASFPEVPIQSLAIVHASRLLAEAWLAQWGGEEIFRTGNSRLLATLGVNCTFLADVYSELPKEIDKVRASLI